MNAILETVNNHRPLYETSNLSLSKSGTKQRAFEEVVYYTLSTLLLTINLDHSIRYPIFILSKNLSAILVLDTDDKWEEFWSCLSGCGYPIELQDTAHSMILQWYTLLNK